MKESDFLKTSFAALTLAGVLSATTWGVHFASPFINNEAGRADTEPLEQIKPGSVRIISRDASGTNLGNKPFIRSYSAIVQTAAGDLLQCYGEAVDGKHIFMEQKAGSLSYKELDPQAISTSSAVLAQALRPAPEPLKDASISLGGCLPYHTSLSDKTLAAFAHGHNDRGRYLLAAEHPFLGIFARARPELIDGTTLDGYNMTDRNTGKEEGFGGLHPVMEYSENPISVVKDGLSGAWGYVRGSNAYKVDMQACKNSGFSPDLYEAMTDVQKVVVADIAKLDCP